MNFSGLVGTLPMSAKTFSGAYFFGIGGNFLGTFTGLVAAFAGSASTFPASTHSGEQYNSANLNSNLKSDMRIM